jgi:hypothetical protein
MAFLIGLAVVVAVLIGIFLGRKSSEPPRHDALGQELDHWAQEQDDLPERQRRASAEAGRRVDVRYPESAKPSSSVSP